MKPNNPFLITGYHSPEYFCDRKQETETLKKLVSNEMVYKSSDGYIVYDRFMAIWLKQKLF